MLNTSQCVIDFILVVLFLDGLTQGDGTSVGKCPNSLKCLSTGECRVCKVIDSVHEGCSGAHKCLSTGVCNVCGLISGTHEECVSTSTSPVCDADSSTSIIDDTAVEKEAVCKGCTKSGLTLDNHMN